jgi:hypothetical protein
MRMNEIGKDSREQTSFQLKHCALKKGLTGNPVHGRVKAVFIPQV